MVLMDNEICLCWNACGLNARARQDVVSIMVFLDCVLLLGLQETKLHVIDDQLIYSMLSSSFAYTFVQNNGNHGGILVAWRTTIWSRVPISQSSHVLTVKLTHHSLMVSWWLTTVYGPQGDAVKVAFLQELHAARLNCLGQWLLWGEFNLIYKADDKHNSRLNSQLMAAFCKFLDDLDQN
jgi:exonuclease III